MKAFRLMMAALLALAMLCGAACAQEEGHAPKKVVYLTFDDGPKADTPELLALLEEEGVPATFFFVGQKVRTFPEEARMVYESGHAIGCHTVYHSYSTLKSGPVYVQKDFNNFITIMREIVSPQFTTDLYRFPGGSTSYKRNIRQTVVDMGCAWFDWNAMTADTEAGMTSDDLFHYVVRTAGDEEVVIILAHEGIKRTRWMLPQMIAYFKDRGYEFRALSTGPEDRELLSYCPANMQLPPIEEAGEETEETP